jgi:hypothetical protein
MVKNKYGLGETEKMLKGFTWKRQYDDDSDDE